VHSLIACRIPLARINQPVRYGAFGEFQQNAHVLLAIEFQFIPLSGSRVFDGIQPCPRFGGLDAVHVAKVLETDVFVRIVQGHETKSKYLEDHKEHLVCSSASDGDVDSAFPRESVFAGVARSSRLCFLQASEAPGDVCSRVTHWRFVARRCSP